MENQLDTLQQRLQQAKTEIQKVIIGQTQVIDLALITLLTRQHALFEGVPGVGKTLLVRTLSRVLGATFNRIQFTPDLMPSEITGTNVFNLETRTFDLVKGPVFTEFLLADEINRAPAKTQSALLQAMQERQVTIDRQTFNLAPSFTVFATQNPVEYEGTYPLPEAQKDRFMMKIDMNYPSIEEEQELALRSLGIEAPEQILESDTLQPVCTIQEWQDLRNQLVHVTLRDEIVGYAVELVRKTRSMDMIMVGAGPRATQALLLASRAMAVVENRDFVTPDDMKYLAPFILGHRIVMRPEYEIEGYTLAEVIDALLKEVPVPR